MVGNPICVQIPWDTNPEALAKWANVSDRLLDLRSPSCGLIRCFHLQGQTGFPWIDAIMTQLREEGWIHHLARHAVACFLTRGDLWISWEEGMKVAPPSSSDFLRRSRIVTLNFFRPGVRRAAARRRLVGERRHVDVAVVLVVLPPVLPLLLPGQVRQESGSERRFHQVSYRSRRRP